MKRIIHILLIMAALAACLVPALAEDLSGFDGAAFSPLDGHGRAGSALAVLSADTLDDTRYSISRFRPSGFETIEYADEYLFNRCHLIAARLAKDTEVAENLVTGTRQMNTAMRLIENQIADYLIETGNHVIYRVTPDFHGDELICRGVTMLARSIEDGGLDIDVYIENVQDGCVIDYGGTAQSSIDAEGDYVLNTKSMRFHRPDCPGAEKIADRNRQTYHGTRSSLIEQGYKPCGSCEP